jgi:Uma2 family endonuclease
MPGTVANYAVRKEPEQAPRRFVKRWTRTEYEHLVDIGVFTPEDRIELVNGDIIKKMPHNPPHAGSIGLVSKALARILTRNQSTRIQLPLALGALSEPEPDIAVVEGDERDYLVTHPTGALLVVEVTHTTHRLDRGAKSGVYAEAGVPEYWIVDLRAGTLEVRRSPVGAAYQGQNVLGRGDQITPLFAPNAVVEVADLLP